MPVELAQVPRLWASSVYTEYREEGLAPRSWNVKVEKSPGIMLAVLRFPPSLMEGLRLTEPGCTGPPSPTDHIPITCVYVFKRPATVTPQTVFNSRTQGQNRGSVGLTKHVAIIWERQWQCPFFLALPKPTPRVSRLPSLHTPKSCATCLNVCSHISPDSSPQAL